MQPITIYYNPKCSKSNKALRFLKDKSLLHKVKYYLTEGLNEEELKDIIQNYYEDYQNLVRNKEPEYQQYMSNKQVTKENLISLLIKFPKCLQRPLLLKNGAVIIGREEKELNRLQQQ